MPASPNAEYYNSSALSVAIIAVMEMELPYDHHHFPAIHLLSHSFLPINPRFSSIMVESDNRGKKWKRVPVNVENHLKTASYPEDEPIEFYNKCLEEYLAKMSMDGFPQDQPLWEMHIFKYPTSKACWHLIFKLHHCLGDGYSLVGALLSTMQRADDPSLPLTFPSRQSSSTLKMAKNIAFFKRIPAFFMDTLKDFGWSVLRSSILEDDQNPIRSGKEMVELCPMNITTVRFSLDQLKHIKTSLGVTINDVIVGVIFCGIRLYMKEKNGAMGGSAGANALVVFNSRAIGVGYKSVEEMLKPNAEMAWGNRFGFFHIAIPKMMDGKEEEEDGFMTINNPLHFIMEAHRMIKKKRNSAAGFLTAKLLQTMRKFRGSEVTSKYIYSAMKNSSMAVSNVIGPVEKMVLANHPIKGLFYTVTGIPQSLVITMMSYMGKLNVVFRTEKDYIDPPLFNSCIQHAFRIILKDCTDN
ncbi:wax ester synthase/diacylglycerol acyltransferase 11-like [Impatiens glandulifera]|uniref:wax ester synthase/diacylglycerol acyltransferase 11-like n=1 Tax=Impatiens glandulifera TaxID=253017 RepID=UPI001FB111F0|nr:wax ester synthase/diacylglycerol acyltransferase 11-like [Impatiens glandulifera]